MARVQDADYPPETAKVRSGESLDWLAIVRYISRQLDDLGDLRRVRQFPNGKANLTYLLEFESQSLVLRRPPFGHVAVGAHDMRREFQVLSVLWQHFDRAPRALVLCTEHDVVGSDFIVSEYRTGQGIWGRIPASMAH